MEKPNNEQALVNLVERAFESKNSITLTLEMPSHDAVFDEIAEQ